VFAAATPLYALTLGLVSIYACMVIFSAYLGFYTSMFIFTFSAFLNAILSIWIYKKVDKKMKKLSGFKPW